nr:phosphoribosylglycinamide formyltransferase [Aeromonadaceae bacterium]
PKYQGVKTHARAIAAGDTVHGATVHFVTEELDGGPIVLQARVPIFPEDDESSLAERVLSQEHQLYPLVVNWFCQQRLRMQDGHAWLDGQPLPALGYASDDEDLALS